MPYRTRTAPHSWTRSAPLIPVPHPTWSGEATPADLARPLPAAEFWQRLGL